MNFLTEEVKSFYNLHVLSCISLTLHLHVDIVINGVEVYCRSVISPFNKHKEKVHCMDFHLKFGIYIFKRG